MGGGAADSRPAPSEIHHDAHCEIEVGATTGFRSGRRRAISRRRRRQTSLGKIQGTNALFATPMSASEAATRTTTWPAETSTPDMNENTSPHPRGLILAPQQSTYPAAALSSHTARIILSTAHLPATPGTSVGDTVSPADKGLSPKFRGHMSAIEQPPPPRPFASSSTALRRTPPMWRCPPGGGEGCTLPPRPGRSH